MYQLPKPTFLLNVSMHVCINEALCLVTYVQLTVKVNSWLTQHLLTLIRFVSMMHFNCKDTPTNDTKDSCHIQSVEVV